MLPTIIRAVRQGRWVWVDNGEYPYSVCHVKNVCEGIILACEKARSRAVYFLKDGPPMKFRDFFSALIQTQGITPGTRSMPRWLANGLAPLVEIFWRLFRLHGEPPLSREILAFFLNPVSINDHKARKELGYTGYITANEGLAELRKHNIQRPPV
jgi:nucleoside-diphosphate-sugar epimerase